MGFVATQRALRRFHPAATPPHPMRENPISNTIHALADDVQAELAHLRQQVDGLMTQSISPTVSALAHRAEDAAHAASHAVTAKADELSATVKAQPLAAIAVAGAAGFLLAGLFNFMSRR
jgi:ElaB/YqjD/DUF883 family membrane-anchored ribosome-binding protein